MGKKNINSFTIFGGGGIEELCCIINFILVIIKHYKAFNFNFVKKMKNNKKSADEILI